MVDELPKYDALEATGILKDLLPKVAHERRSTASRELVATVLRVAGEVGLQVERGNVVRMPEGDSWRRSPGVAVEMDQGGAALRHEEGRGTPETVAGLTFDRTLGIFVGGAGRSAVAVVAEALSKSLHPEVRK